MIPFFLFITFRPTLLDDLPLVNFFNFRSKLLEAVRLTPFCDSLNFRPKLSKTAGLAPCNLLIKRTKLAKIAGFNPCDSLNFRPKLA